MRGSTLQRDLIWVLLDGSQFITHDERGNNDYRLFMPNCGPSHRHFAKAHTSRRAPLCGRFLLIVPAPSGNVSESLTPGRNPEEEGGSYSSPSFCYFRLQNQTMGAENPWELGCPPFLLGNYARRGTEVSSSVGGFPYERDLCGWTWPKSRPATRGHPTGAATGAAADRQQGRRGRRRQASGRWIRKVAAAEFGRVELASFPKKHHTPCCAMRAGTRVTGVPSGNCLGVLAAPLCRTARLSLASE